MIYYVLSGSTFDTVVVLWEVDRNRFFECDSLPDICSERLMFQKLLNSSYLTENERIEA